MKLFLVTLLCLYFTRTVFSESQKLSPTAISEMRISDLTDFVSLRRLLEDVDDEAEDAIQGRNEGDAESKDEEEDEKRDVFQEGQVKTPGDRHSHTDNSSSEGKTLNKTLNSELAADETAVTDETDKLDMWTRNGTRQVSKALNQTLAKKRHNQNTAVKDADREEYDESTKSQQIGNEDLVHVRDVDDNMDREQLNRTATKKPVYKPGSSNVNKPKPKHAQRIPFKKSKAKGKSMPDTRPTKDEKKMVKGNNGSLSGLDIHVESTEGVNSTNPETEQTEESEEKSVIDADGKTTLKHSKSNKNVPSSPVPKMVHKEIDRSAPIHIKGKNTGIDLQGSDETTAPVGDNESEEDAGTATLESRLLNGTISNITKHKHTHREEENIQNGALPDLLIEGAGNGMVSITTHNVSEHTQKLDNTTEINNSSVSDVSTENDTSAKELDTEFVEVVENATMSNRTIGNFTYIAEKQAGKSLHTDIAQHLNDPMDPASRQGNPGYDDADEYIDFMQDFSDLPSKFHDTAHKVPDHLAPNIHKLANTSKEYFNKANQQITQSFSPLVGKRMAPFFASLISYCLLLIPLVAVLCLFQHIRAYISLQKVLLFANIYLAAYFATLLLATSIIGEPMTFFYRSSMMGYVHLQLVQALGYILYLILQTCDLVSVYLSERLPIKVTVALQWFVAFMIGMHYYVTVFHRAMVMKVPHTNWKIYGMYSVGFLVLCLCARINRTRKGYSHLRDVDSNKNS